MAYYLRRPSNIGLFGETKLKFNFGEGIKEASTSQQASALISLLTPAQISQFNVQPIGPERSRTFDFGLDQRIFNGRAVLGVTLYYNNFYNLISFLGTGDLISIGVPVDVANATPLGGAYVNATSQRAKGAEIDYKMDLGHGFLFQGEYTYTDGLVTKAFGAPPFNPLFPNIPIGAFSPLEGARPFLVAPHSGSVALFYNRKKFNGAFTGYMVGRQRRQHVPRRWLLRQLHAPAESQPRLRLSKVRFERRLRLQALHLVLHEHRESLQPTLRRLIRLPVAPIHNPHRHPLHLRRPQRLVEKVTLRFEVS